ncbi:MAG: hypothetical protein E7A56_08020 [Cutibacterium avidum]|nr:hypothetical protein [Cutibacterium avidum]
MDLLGAERPFLQSDDLIDIDDDEDDQYVLEDALHGILAATITDCVQRLRRQLEQLLGPTTFFTAALTVSPIQTMQRLSARMTQAAASATGL